MNAPNTPYRPLLTDAARPATFDVAAIDEHGEVRDVPVAGEHPLTLYVDKQELLTLMTLGAAPEALAIGYLRNQRLVALDRRHRRRCRSTGNATRARSRRATGSPTSRRRRPSAPRPPAAARARCSAT